MSIKDKNKEITGLYDKSFEKDSCGFGLISNIDDKPSHWLINTATRGSSNELSKSDGESADHGGEWLGDVESTQVLAPLAAPGKQADQNQYPGGIRDQHEEGGNGDGDCRSEQIGR